MSNAAFLAVAPAGDGFSSLAEGPVNVTAVIHGKTKRSVALTAPRRTTCEDLKALLAAEGAVAVIEGLAVLEEEGGRLRGDAEELELEEGSLVHLRSAGQAVCVTVLAAAAADGEEEVYELALPSETTGAELKAQVEEATAGALKPQAIFLAGSGSDAPPALKDTEPVRLAENQLLLVQRAAQEAPPAAAGEGAGGLLGALRGGRVRSKSGTQGPPAKFCIRSALNIRAKGARISCTSKEEWSGCVVFDVPDAEYFEVAVQLLEDAPKAEAAGLAGRWMLGVAPSAVAEVKTEKQRRQLLGLGHWLTVCHGHPTKIQAPSMPRGTCGEDCAALPGELRKGQTLTLRWAAAKKGGALMAQVDEGDIVTLPYAPAPFDDVRPCLVFGGRPAELRVLQLESGLAGGA